MERKIKVSIVLDLFEHELDFLTDLNEGIVPLKEKLVRLNEVQRLKEKFKRKLL